MLNKICRYVLSGFAAIFIILGILGIIGAFNLEIDNSIHEIIQMLAVILSFSGIATGFIMLTILVTTTQPKNTDIVELPVYDMADINKKLKEDV